MPGRRRKIRLKFGRKRAVTPIWMWEYEAAIILADFRKAGPEVRHSAWTLDRDNPGRYNVRQLSKALKRMAEQGDLIRDGSIGTWRTSGGRHANKNHAYRLSIAREEARAA